jgi:hypothetical protein
MAKSDTYIQYGVPSDWAASYIAKEVSCSLFKSTPQKQLVNKYGIPVNQVQFVKRCLKRNPIDPRVLEDLLNNNRYVCCLCRGQKGKSYIIHHIEEYSISQDNSYYNLAVLCPNDHDDAHKSGLSLTHKVTAEQIKKAKVKWEKFVYEEDVQIACKQGEIHEIDFVNPLRVLGLYKSIFTSAPATEYSEWLIRENALLNNGTINDDFIRKKAKNPVMPFMSFGPGGAWHLSSHFIDSFKQVLVQQNFQDLDELLRKSKIKEGIVGETCYYVGGLYGKMPQLPVTAKTPPTHLYFHRRDFWVEWKVDPRYMTSSTALHRLADHREYLIYGRILNVGIKDHKEKKYVHIDIRPYLFGTPNKSKMRRPAIAFMNQFDDFDMDEEWESF